MQNTISDNRTTPAGGYQGDYTGTISGLSARQIAWANGHDWFLRDNGTISCHEETFYHGLLLSSKIAVFSDIKALRIWAGY